MMVYRTFHQAGRQKPFKTDHVSIEKAQCEAEDCETIARTWVEVDGKPHVYCGVHASEGYQLVSLTSEAPPDYKHEHKETGHKK